MKVSVRIEQNIREPEVVILTDRMTAEVEEILQKLSEKTPQMLAGFCEDTVRVLAPEEILRVYAQQGKVFAGTEAGEYLLRLRLYELEERLAPYSFVRISNSEIISLKKVRHFDLSFTGTICVILTDGTKTFVSRRYVPRIRQMLGM
ncbi:MAG: LytTR family transcriptional regulator [Lachnospiraceae bacterium]|jgi:DNA-binding LytR/AlgR family response regulator|nr:LytTR family transcriptional regulator [Lachnospiraceae bacterium]MCI1398581.1 LytTR family transcriptional regulator [Lachnospiraceae bacterium]MCI1422763.1 LytTR family transcriptional regulator [Lachnospiraceae bacterium]MCI1451548.1 LytTR family transcriptional regulator [Lachnospiraceae bacterium]MDD5848702.1 LytTR family DNA-binding domain-containing protein [Bacillota bacterium]